MRHKKKKWHGSDAVFLVFLLLLFSALVWFGIQVVQKARSGQRICQSVVPLGRMEYSEELLEEAEKIPGIRSVTPVLELSVQMRAGDYTMETTWLGVDLSELVYEASAGAATPLGAVPALLLGEKCLGGMTDSNGQSLSEKKQRELLSRFQETGWQYRLTGTEPDGALPTWSPCRVAGVLSAPEEDIYLSFDQAAMLAGSSELQSVKKILLTVQGEERFENARRCFGGEQG